VVALREKRTLAHKQTLQKFFAAFKSGEMLFPKQIIKRSGLPRNTVFRKLKYGVEHGFLGKEGRRYFVKFPETLGTKQVELPKDWESVYKIKLQQVAELNKVTVEQLPDWIKDIVKVWILHDALWYKKLQLDDLMIRSPRQKLDDEKAALQENPEKMRCMRLTQLEKQWKEVFDKWVLRQLKQGKNSF
jgi:hypothetical protein